MRHRGLPLLCLLLLLTGCAGGVCLTPAGKNSSLTLSVVAAAGNRHVGASVQWGGTLLDTRHRKDTTEFEVIAYPLDDCGRPRVGSKQRGRFIILYPGFLETTDYRIGQSVSATGRIVGLRKGRLGDADYGFPLLESYKVHPWPDRQLGTHGSASRPWVNIGIGGGNHRVFGGVGVVF